MKKVASLVLLFVLVASICSAQDEIGKRTVEISANFTGSMYGVATMPQLSYFITDTIELSGAFHFETGEMDSMDYDAYGLTILGIYNFYPASIERLIPFVEAGFNVASFEVEGIDAVDSTGFVIGGGARYLVTDNFSVNAILSYQTGDLEYMRFGIGLSVFIF